MQKCVKQSNIIWKTLPYFLSKLVLWICWGFVFLMFCKKQRRWKSVRMFSYGPFGALEQEPKVCIFTFCYVRHCFGGLVRKTGACLPARPGRPKNAEKSRENREHSRNLREHEITKKTWENRENSRRLERTRARRSRENRENPIQFATNEESSRKLEPTGMYGHAWS